MLLVLCAVVVIATVKVGAPAPTSVMLFVLGVHAAPVGAPLHAMETTPWNPPLGVSWSVNVALLPAGGGMEVGAPGGPGGGKSAAGAPSTETDFGWVEKMWGGGGGAVHAPGVVGAKG